MQLPAQFGKYQLEKFLGGGMSQVYQATDTVLGRTVAVKILTEDGCRDDDSKKRFLLEARMSGNIVHDNIIRIHDYGEMDGRPFIVMEFLTGEDLRSAIDNGRTGDVKHRISIALQAARALAFVHTKNIVHRDIKPDNLHIDESGRVRLMDFGIAKAQNFNITREGVAVGTPYYMAPEQVLGKPITPAADIYSFGVVMYEMLTGLKPVTGETVESLFYLILNQQLDIAPLELAGAPKDLISLVTRCAAKKPEERPQSFDAIIAELEGILKRLEGGGGSGGTQPPASLPSKKSTPLLVATGVAVLAVTAVVVVILLPKSKPDAEKKQEPEKKLAQQSTLPPRLQDGYGEMILVPGGDFISGNGVDSKTKTLPDFYIDKTEVSVAAWNQFAQAMGKPVRDERADYPATKISLDEAAEYCTWAGKRMPLAEEWEKAARGSDGRRYPWSNAPEANRANVMGNPSLPPKQPQPVDSMPEGATPGGILHMGGNVWEWTKDAGKPTPELVEAFKGVKATADEPWTTIRGGGFDHDLSAAVAYEFSTVPARIRVSSIGFRCAKDPPKNP